MAIKPYLNIGCGRTFHEAWENIDIISRSPYVRQYDILKGLPYADHTFQVVYHSHIIEHLTREEAISFLHEAVRVLKRNGIMRVVTPDLETIARLYLAKLQDSIASISGADDDYEWILLELFDQAVRDRPGGNMSLYLKEERNREFVLSRIGNEALNYWRADDQNGRYLERIRGARLSRIVNRLQEEIVSFLAGSIGGRKARKACKNGFFRNSGEVHKFLYDRYSLEKSLRSAGLSDIRICLADESRIPDFSVYQLDMVDGKMRKPDSIFMEGVKH